jgi:hypothetical protein
MKGICSLDAGKAEQCASESSCEKTSIAADLHHLGTTLRLAQGADNLFITVPFPLHVPSCFVIFSEDSPAGNPPN